LARGDLINRAVEACQESASSDPQGGKGHQEGELDPQDETAGEERARQPNHGLHGRLAHPVSI